MLPFFRPNVHRMKNKKDVQGLIRALEYRGRGSSEVVDMAIRALGEIRDPQAAPALVDILRVQPHHQVAASAIKQIGEPAVDAVVVMLGAKYSKVRQCATEILGAIGGDRVVPYLTNALTDPEEIVREAAEAALLDMSTPASKVLHDSLFAALCNAELDMRGHVARVLRKLDWQPGLNRESAYYYSATSQYEKCIPIGAEAVEPLIEIALNHRYPSHRERATNALGAIGDPKAVELLLTAFTDEELHTRARAATALGELGDARAVDALINSLEEPDSWWQSYVVETLGRLGDRRALAPLNELYEDESRTSIKDTVLELALASLGDTRFASRAVDKFMSELHVRYNSGPQVKLTNDDVFAMRATQLVLAMGEAALPHLETKAAKHYKFAYSRELSRSELRQTAGGLFSTGSSIEEIDRTQDVRAHICAVMERIKMRSPDGVSFKIREPEMILIPAGEFLMGSDPNKDKNAFPNEQPQHTLHLPDYYLAKTPVTNSQYLTFVQAASHRPPRHWEAGKPPSGKEEHPVVNVTWHDAMAYCQWLAEVTGKPYRLPSEAEWEKGARGTDGRIYPWGDQWDASRCNSTEGGQEDTTPVGAYPQGASPYGLLDMAGNVSEWTSSLYRSYPYRADDGREDPTSSVRRGLRGGAFLSALRYVRCASRGSGGPDNGDSSLGFRVAAALFSPTSGR